MDEEITIIKRKEPVLEDAAYLSDQPLRKQQTKARQHMVKIHQQHMQDTLLLGEEMADVLMEQGLKDLIKEFRSKLN